MTPLAAHVRARGTVPLAWAGGTPAQDYLNLGDALSPVMVALLCGLPVERVPVTSRQLRLGAVGTIGQNFRSGHAVFWGTGCSPYRRAAGRPRARFEPDPGMTATLAATRGPLSAMLLSGGGAPDIPFGDPVWLLPRFHAPPVTPKWDLGVIVHLSDLEGPGLAARADPAVPCFGVSGEDVGRVRLITTRTEVSAEALGARIDEILACRRILSRSLHGLVIAESYGIPCLTLADGARAGVEEVRISPSATLDWRMLDLYAGLGCDRLPVWRQPRDLPTDWSAAMQAIDTAWSPVHLDEGALIGAFPLDLAPSMPERALSAATGLWSLPLITDLPYRGDPTEIRRLDREQAKADTAASADRHRRRREALRRLDLPVAPSSARPEVAVDTPDAATLRIAAPRLMLREGRLHVPLVWARTPADSGIVNLGDALSPLIVGAISGLPVTPAAAVSAVDRIAAVGTIAHNLAGGRVHLWGTGLDTSRHPTGGEAPWSHPPDTSFAVHATRGPFTAAALRRAGVPAPACYGDPAYLLPRLWPLAPPKTHDLGIVLHLSELEAQTLEAGAKAAYRRYAVPEHFAERVRIISLNVAPTPAAIRDRVAEIAQCRAILSTSLHGLVIADAYGVPSAWFGLYGRGPKVVDVLDPTAVIDHRMRDLYAGLGLAEVPVYATPRHEHTDWAEAIAFATGLAASGFDPAPLLEAFPGPLAVDPAATRWPNATDCVEGEPSLALPL
ncbi:MAG: polysaccharide pyruvyl transferase family protein [Pseudomonadota bacterium]